MYTIAVSSCRVIFSYCKNVPKHFAPTFIGTLYSVFNAIHSNNNICDIKYCAKYWCFDLVLKYLENSQF